MRLRLSGKVGRVGSRDVKTAPCDMYTGDYS